MIIRRKHKLLASLTFAVFLWLSLTSSIFADLPPRPPVEPKEPQGAVILLRVKNPKPGLWTEVEWLDAHGTWHTVDGWRGSLDDGETKQWWVGPEDFSTGPFRWLVFDAEGGTVLAFSSEFYLPEANRHFLNVVIKLPDS